ncbi:GntR family transcriptional regulator [Haloarcula sp. JP-L23]|uniref:GntR family transcriptional regulator n=1 Tax=Haloarcula sp. JP-L23 TaxID=2716717 RepID=UPI001D0381EA
MSGASYDGDPLDGTVQYITERPELADGGETVDVDGEQERAHGRGFEGADADTAATLLASVRENHTAQATGRYARNPDDPESHATVFVRADAMPTDFADVQVSGIEWTFTDVQRDIVATLRSSTTSMTAREIADDVGVTKEHVRQTLNRLEGMDAVQAFEGGGVHGATLYADDGLPNAGVVDLGETANDSVLDTYTWSLAIRGPAPAVDALTTGSSTDDQPESSVWDWRNTSD